MYRAVTCSLKQAAPVGSRDKLAGPESERRAASERAIFDQMKLPSFFALNASDRAIGRPAKGAQSRFCGSRSNGKPAAPPWRALPGVC